MQSETDVSFFGLSSEIQQQIQQQHQEGQPPSSSYTVKNAVDIECIMSKFTKRFKQSSDINMNAIQSFTVVNQEQQDPLVDIVFSFDTTGSMSSVIDSVRKNLTETVERLFVEIQGLRIGIIVHGDYCDYPSMFWKLDLTNNIDVIKSFIKLAPNTYGGDAPECYELVLHQCKSMSWQSEIKVVVVIGDSMPHEAGYEAFDKDTPAVPDLVHQNVLTRNHCLKIDWKTELKALQKKQIIIFSCQALTNNRGQKSKQIREDFYEFIANETNGLYFPLEQLSAFKEYMVAICMKAADAAENLQLIRQRQQELVANLQEQNNNLNEEHKQQYEREIAELKSAESIAKTKSLFTEDTLHVTSTLRTQYNKQSRSQRYEDELYSKNSNFFENNSSLSFMNVMNNRPISTPAKHSSKKYDAYNTEAVSNLQNKLQGLQDFKVNLGDDEFLHPGSAHVIIKSSKYNSSNNKLTNKVDTKSWFPRNVSLESVDKEDSKDPGICLTFDDCVDGSKQ